MYKIFGYTDDLKDFEFWVDGFIKAIKLYKKLYLNNVVFICREGNSKTCLFVENFRLRYKNVNTNK